jgi:hypothetical protein
VWHFGVSASQLGLPNVSVDQAIVGVVKLLYIAAGSLGVIFVIVGGLRYTMSGGDPKQVEAAKNTILYAIIGIIVAIAAFAIVNTVLKATT